MLFFLGNAICISAGFYFLPPMGRLKIKCRLNYFPQPNPQTFELLCSNDVDGASFPLLCCLINRLNELSTIWLH